MSKDTVARKVMILGLDAPIAPRLYDYAMQGHLPAIRALIDRGVFARHCLVPFPTITPPNWTTIVTGAWPGTHGITCFNVHVPGDPLDETHQGFDCREVQAEYLWNAIARIGKRSIVVNYPTTWPPSLENGIQVAGAGLSPNEYRFGAAGPAPFTCDLAAEQLFATEEYPQATTVELADASGWANALDAPALAADLPLRFRMARSPVQPVTWHMLVLDSAGRGFDRVLLSETPDAGVAFADLQVGRWSDILTREFQTDDGPRRAQFRCKLVELSPDARRLRLYVTPIAATDGFASPAEVARGILSGNGLPLPYPAFQAFNMEWIDSGTFLEVIEMSHVWLADCASHLLGTQNWDLFVMHIHTPDHAYHGFSNKADPATAADAAQAEEYQRIELGFYQSIDRALAKVLAHAGDDTVVVLTSDHGAKATTRPFPIQKVLRDAGLLALKPRAGGEGQEIDWANTRAVQQRSCYVYVNLRGRDPQGIVEPGEEYERVRDQVLDALLAYRDPESGQRAVALALKREDARIIGLQGERMGDVVYAITPEFGGQHGPHLPTAKWGIGSLEGLLIMAGPNVKRGEMLDRTCNLPDIVPTVCHLANWPVPAQAEGAILYQALADPNARADGYETLQRNYARLLRAHEAEKALTHTYNE